MLLQVHDELVFEVKKDLISKVVPELRSLMSNVFKDKDTKGVPIAVEAKVGANWAEMDKLVERS
jgi:DNA polymerase-1